RPHPPTRPRPTTAPPPASDRAPDPRTAGRDGRRAEYKYNHVYVSPLAFVEDVPSRDRFPIDFTTLVLGKIMTNVSNQADADSALRRTLRKMDLPGTGVVLGASTAVRGVAGLVGEFIGLQADAGRLQTIDDY